MECPVIQQLNFDEESQAALERIRDMPGLGNAFAGALGGGVFVTIFAGSGPLGAAFNIATTDWNTFGKAMRAVPDVTRARIEREALNQWSRAQIANDVRLARFWEAVHNGCRLP